MPKRIQRKRSKGWRLPEGAVCVTRPGKWGNPFQVGVHGAAAECVRLFRQLMTIRNPIALAMVFVAHPHLDRSKCDVLRSARFFLHGKDLACWCSVGSPCHADVLLELANASS